MGLTKTIAISGKPGLYNIVTQSKGGFIVESIADKKKFPVNNAHNISILNDIAIYTYDEEIPLRQVFLNIFEKEGGKTSINHKDSNNKLMAYFSEILPDFDEDRVYPSNVKKVIQWYNLLLDSGFDFATLKDEEETTETAE